jgi:hypothetical protein
MEWSGLLVLFVLLAGIALVVWQVVRIEQRRAGCRREHHD